MISTFKNGISATTSNCWLNTLKPTAALAIFFSQNLGSWATAMKSTSLRWHAAKNSACRAGSSSCSSAGLISGGDSTEVEECDTSPVIELSIPARGTPASVWVGADTSWTSEGDPCCRCSVMGVVVLGRRVFFFLIFFTWLPGAIAIAKAKKGNHEAKFKAGLLRPLDCASLRLRVLEGMAVTKSMADGNTWQRMSEWCLVCHPYSVHIFCCLVFRLFRL